MQTYRQLQTAQSPEYMPWLSICQTFGHNCKCCWQGCCPGAISPCHLISTCLSLASESTQTAHDCPNSSHYTSFDLFQHSITCLWDGQPYKLSWQNLATPGCKQRLLLRCVPSVSVPHATSACESQQGFCIACACCEERCKWLQPLKADGQLEKYLAKQGLAMSSHVVMQ